MCVLSFLRQVLLHNQQARNSIVELFFSKTTVFSTNQRLRRYELRISNEVSSIVFIIRSMMLVSCVFEIPEDPSLRTVVVSTRRIQTSHSRRTKCRAEVRKCSILRTLYGFGRLDHSQTYARASFTSSSQMHWSPFTFLELQSILYAASGYQS